MSISVLPKPKYFEAANENSAKKFTDFWHGSISRIEVPEYLAGRVVSSELIADLTQAFAGAAMPTDQELFDAKLARSEAQTDTKITRIEGKLDVIVNSIGSLSEKVGEHRRDRNLIIGTIVGTGIVAVIAMGGLFVSMATYGDALFGRGMNVRDLIHAVITEQQQLPKPPVTPTK